MGPQEASLMLKKRVRVLRKHVVYEVGSKRRKRRLDRRIVTETKEPEDRSSEPVLWLLVHLNFPSRPSERVRV